MLVSGFVALLALWLLGSSVRFLSLLSASVALLASGFFARTAPGQSMP